jgi:hypothetical protein
LPVACLAAGQEPKEERMARRVITQLVDDLDGEELTAGTGETVRFELDGAEYEIDLSSRNATKLRAVLEPYVAGARKRPASRRPYGDVVDAPRTGRRGGMARGSSREELANIRAWARRNGYTVSPRGRISGEVREAYHAAHA